MVRVNDKWDVPWHAGMTVGDVLAACHFTHHYIAVSINGMLIPPEDQTAHPVADSDDVRVVHIIAGG